MIRFEVIEFKGDFMNCNMRIINTKTAPDPIGPYAQAIDIGTFIFVSGQIPIIPNTMIIPDGVYEQTYQTLQNIRNIVESQKLSINNIVKTTLFIKNIEDLSEINISYKNFFYKYATKYKDRINFPVRSCIEVSKLPNNVLVEIDAIAIRY